MQAATQQRCWAVLPSPKRCSSQTQAPYTHSPTLTQTPQRAQPPSLAQVEKTLQKGALEQYLAGGLSEASIITQVENGKGRLAGDAGWVGGGGG